MEKIEELLKKYDTEILKNPYIECSRRGYCGHINITSVFNYLIKDLELTEHIIYRKDSNQQIDVYKNINNNIFVKRLCICASPCGNNNCSKLKIRNECNGHHVILVSDTASIDVKESDYIIDLTYKQMLYTRLEEENPDILQRMKSLPNYLFLKVSDYMTYSSSDRWKENITQPCHFIINNLRQKYLKYKNKYLKLKKTSLVGGNLEIKLDRLDSIPFITSLNINLIENSDHILVPMNCYEIVGVDNLDILTTTGFAPCVLVAIYNPRFGRYFAHYLTFNEFVGDLTNSCEILGNNKQCEEKASGIDTSFPNKVCDNNSSKIVIPLWVNNDDTVIHILNNREIFHTLSRIKQIRDTIFKGTINIYFPSHPPSESQLLRKMFDIKNIKLLSYLSGGDDIAPEIFMMTGNGTIYFGMKDDLSSNARLTDFYKSYQINRISSPHDNRKCVSKYGFRKSYFESNREKYRAIDIIPNKSADKTRSVTSNAYSTAFFKI